MMVNTITNSLLHMLGVDPVHKHDENLSQEELRTLVAEAFPTWTPDGRRLVFSRFLDVDINSGVLIGMGIVFVYAVMGGCAVV